jgi:hypothetical protein
MSLDQWMLLFDCCLPFRRLAVFELYVCIGAAGAESDEMQNWGAEVQKSGRRR